VTSAHDVKRAPLPDGVEPLLPAYLAGQKRWFAGEGTPDRVQVEWSRQLWSDGEGRHMWQAVVEVQQAHFQILLGERPSGQPAEFLHGHEDSVLGAVGSSYFYDASHDTELARVLLEVASDGKETARLARPMMAEQSNTSLVFDDRLILKVFRRLHAGHNPDVAITTALFGAGFRHVAEPLVSWREEPYDLAFGQRFLAGASEGWALALTSLRDLYNSVSGLPSEVGGDFAAEAQRLGTMTAEMHLALSTAVARPVDRAGASERWRRLVGDICQGLDSASEAAGRDLGAAADPFVRRLRTVTDPGPFGRVHGDYHLGQVMQTDDGWYVLDFEGEPTKPLSERIEAASPLKDVAGMLRSFDYASRYALTDRAERELPELEPRALAWSEHNRQAFLDGYRSVPGIDALLPDPVVAPVVLMAYELDKALYELAYERSHRPEWVVIPLHAINRFIDGEDRGAR
jgi:maltokinase